MVVFYVYCGLPSKVGPPKILGLPILDTQFLKPHDPISI